MYIIAILFVSAFIRLYHITTEVPFFGDQGWFYISARDMLLTGNIPLVGITSSHTWLHQGPLWTYILGFIFFITHFSPFAPFIFTAIMGILTTYLMYIIGNRIFGEKTSLVASFIFASSPLMIMQSRNAYHTSLIPTFVLLLIYALHKLREKKHVMLTIITGLFAVLYNLGLTNISIVLGSILLIIIDTQLKTAFFTAIKNKWILFWSFFVWLILMTPIILYDVHHGFPQTLGFSAWIGYKTVMFLPSLLIHGIHVDSSLPFGKYSLTFIRQLIFAPNGTVALVIFIAIITSSIILLIRKFKGKSFYFQEKLLLTFFFIPLLFYCIQFIPSEGYIPVLFIGFCFLVGYIVSSLKKQLCIFATIILLLIGLTNLWYITTHRMMMVKDEYGYSLADRLLIVIQAKKQITKDPVNIKYKGPLEQFESNRMNYEYLFWWQGIKLDQKNYKEIIVITDDEKKLSFSMLE